MVAYDTPPQIYSSHLTSCHPHIHRGRALAQAGSRNQPPFPTTVSPTNNREAATSSHYCEIKY